MSTMMHPKNNRCSFSVIVVICMTLFVTVANVWMSVEQVIDLRPPIALNDGSAQQRQQRADESPAETASFLAETQRLLESALIQANTTQTQMAAEIARNRLVISKLQEHLEQMKKGSTMEAHALSQREQDDSPVDDETQDSPRSFFKKEKSIMRTPPPNSAVVEPHNKRTTIIDSEKTVAVSSAISSSLATAASTTIITKTSTLSKEANVQGKETTQYDDNAMEFGPVQAWSESDAAAVVRSRRRPNRTIYPSIASIPKRNIIIPFDNSTINPVLPSMKVNAATMLNIEIPLNYSITADMTSTVPWSNVSTVALTSGRFYSGFRNQIMAFTVLIMGAVSLQGGGGGHGQVLLRSLRMKDTFGTNQLMEFAKLWDVAHWNSHYPRLPRLVDYDPILHSQFNYQDSSWYRATPAVRVNGTTGSPIKEEKWYGAHGLFATELPARPHASWAQPRLFTAYMRYAMKGRGPYVSKTAKTIDPSTGKMIGFRNPAEILMLQGAMRPHPNFQAIINRLLTESSLEKGSGNDYLTLHARVEPDMQKHPVCRDRKVLNLTNIFDFIEQKWHEPPVSKIFMPINRQYMELEGYVNKNDPNQTNWIAVHNLKALNHARDFGLWGGRVKVLEFGANALDNTAYAGRPSTGGAMLNFFLGIEAKIFIGTEVSSYSHDILATRFFRNAMENYNYLPDGLHEWTPPGTVDPPGFGC